MTPRQIALVQSSFAQVLPIADTAAGMFYARLFELAPQVRPMFKGDIAEQGRKLMTTLGVVVRGLSSLESVLPAASVLARKHVGYGVKAEDYGSVGEALLWTLDKGLGEGWTPDVAAAWQRAYATLSSYMISEAYGLPKAAE